MARHDWLPAAALAAAPLALAWAVNARVPRPYMDEFFHVPQAARYCAGDWSHYDPMITTFPGTYLVAAAANRVLQWPCDTEGLRLLSAAVCGALLWLLASAAAAVQGGGSTSPAAPTSRPVLSAVAAWSWPVTQFCGALFYTDGASAAAVAAVHALAHRRRRGAAGGWTTDAALAVGCAGAVAMRQTNVVWVLFSCASGALHDPRAAGDLAQLLLLLAGPPRGAGRGSASVGARLAAAGRAALWAVAPALPTVAAFAAFLAANHGAVVLGDAAHHRPVLHGAQLCYLAAVVGAPAVVDAVAAAAGWAATGRLDAPHAAWLHAVVGAFAKPPAPAGVTTRSSTPATRQQQRGGAGGAATAQGRWRPRWGGLAAVVALTAAAGALARWSTIVHPYLLADNRHYGFYVWGRLLGPRPWLRVALAPVYAACALLAATRLATSVEASLGVAHGGGSAPAPPPPARTALAWLWVAGWAACSAATVVPSSLVEPRYFMLPLTLALVHTRFASAGCAWALVAAHAAVHAATAWMFLARPFKGADGAEARFMW